ncbi:MAG: DUF983 domain-containing protein [Alphaproteobacteria bacterium]|nr:DUF983 domain-containing protein [Alphaproteobacteria bacterium]
MTAQASAVLAGLRGRCPNCGEGRIYASYLKLAPRCPACGADFSVADAGDGPAFFVMFVVGFIVVPFAFILIFGMRAPQWLMLALTAALTIGLSLWLLPIAKALLFALQWKHKASEARIDDVA